MSFQNVYPLAQLAPASGQAVQVTDQCGDTVQIALIRDEAGTVHAISQLCTHGDVPLDEGDIEGCEVECWAHGARFNLETGEGTLPATKPVMVYPVEIRDGEIYVDVD